MVSRSNIEMSDNRYFSKLKPKVVKGPGKNWFVTDKPKRNNQVMYKSNSWEECIDYALRLFCSRVRGYAIRYAVAKERGQILKFNGVSR
jgi:hypothetical protein